MFYLDANEEAVRTRFNTLSLLLLVFFYLLTFYLLDDSYRNAWYGFPISIVTYLFLRCLIHRRRAGSAPAFYNNKSKAIKLFLYTSFSVLCFFALQYGAHYPILSQKFTAAEITIASYTEISGDDIGTDDRYWSFDFTVSGKSLYKNTVFSEDPILEELVLSSDFVGCGCGIEYGKWGDIAINPSLPFKYYKEKFGVEGIKLPTWLCLCYSEETCKKKYMEFKSGVVSHEKLYYRVVGDPKLALENKKCPPEDMNFLQVYREENGVPAHDEVLLTFLFAFSATVASSSLLLALGFIHLTENYGNRITFIVLISVATFSLEFSVLSIENFVRNVTTRLLPFIICIGGSGYIYCILLKDVIWKIITAPGRKFMRIFKDDGDSERLILKILWTIWKIIWFIIGIFWAIISLIVLVWFAGRCKIFALKPFRLSEDKYSITYQQKNIKKKNMILNVITIIDAIVFRGGEGVFLLHLLINKKVENELVMTVTLVFVLYEFASYLYPLVKQVLILRSINTMLESLNPRYYNVAVVRRERTLKNAGNNQERRGKEDESIELRRGSQVNNG